MSAITILVPGRGEMLSTLNGRVSTLLLCLQQAAQAKNVEVLVWGHPQNRRVPLPDIVKPSIGWILLHRLPRINQYNISGIGLDRRPIAFFDEIDHPLWDDGLVGPVARFAMSQYHAGKSVGRHLMDSGHRNIAYLSHVHKESWSRERCNGLQDALADECERTRLHLLTREVLSQPSKPRPMGQPSSMLVNQAKKVLDPDEDPESFLQMVRQLYQVEDREHLRLAVQPLLENGLSLPDVTAWVACNDLAAATAKVFLNRSGIDVPAKVEMIGFDHSDLCEQARIPSFGIDFADLAAKMIECLLGKFPNDYGQARIEVPGRLFIPANRG